jgi:hypothetical protein
MTTMGIDRKTRMEVDCHARVHVSIAPRYSISFALSLIYLPIEFAK